MKQTSVVVGVDGSEGGYRALDEASALARALRGRLVVVHVSYTSPLVLTEATGLGVSGVLARSADELASDCAVRCELALLEKGVPWSFRVLHGDPSTELIGVACLVDAAYIVVGRHGHGGLTRLLVGSVAQQLLRHADRTVVVVPPAAPR
jgi:nucleotide-binding universal stress UspA family protein